MSRARDTANQINRVNSSAADATALTVDSSENVLIGKTATGGNVAGMQIINGSFFSHVRDGGVVQVLNRKSSDGDILSFEKDNTAVGNIGVVSDDRMYFATADGLGLQFDKDNNRIIPCDATGGYNSNVELGDEGLAFTNLFLTGGIQFDSRSSKLEDYEEGTWTPSYVSTDATDPTVSYSLRDGRYTKIGRTVIASFRFRGAITGTKVGTLRISGLPFTSANDSAGNGGSIRLTENFGTNAHPNSVSAGSNKTEIILTSYDSSDPRSGLFTAVNVSSTSTSSSGNYILGQVVYDI